MELHDSVRVRAEIIATMTSPSDKDLLSEADDGGIVERDTNGTAGLKVLRGGPSCTFQS